MGIAVGLLISVAAKAHPQDTGLTMRWAQSASSHGWVQQQMTKSRADQLLRKFTREQCDENLPMLTA